MVSRKLTFVIRSFGPALGVLAVGAALAADGPRRGPARPGPVMATESIKAPAVEAAKSMPAPSRSTLVARRRAATAEDKGSVYTDMGDPAARPAVNDIEKAKLDMARAAVDLARSAGTLYRPLPVGGMAMSREQAEAAKAEAAKNHVPVRVENDPAAGVGNFPPLQLRGSEGLTDLEQAKAEALKQGRPAPTREAVVRPSRRTGSRDNGAVKAGKEGR